MTHFSFDPDMRAEMIAAAHNRFRNAEIGTISYRALLMACGLSVTESNQWRVENWDVHCAALDAIKQKYRDKLDFKSGLSNE